MTKAVKRAKLGANLKTREQHYQEQEQSRRQTEMDSLRKRVLDLEGRLLEVDAANETREMLDEEPLTPHWVRPYAREEVRYDKDGNPVSHVVRSADRPEDLHGPTPVTLDNLYAAQAGTWGDSIETRLTALQKDFNQHVEDQMDRNMGFEGEDKLLTQALGVFERRSVEADREITAMLAAAERQLISAVNTLEERVAALETKRPTKETPK